MTELERLDFDAARLVAEHPPRWRHPNKQAVYDVACPPGARHAGRIGYTRWQALPLPQDVNLATALERVEARADVYDYVPALNDARAVEWHVNFADPHLFVAYGSSLFAQDEIQVTEHPALGSLKEALDAGRKVALTTEGARPTPVLVTGVERRCRVNLDGLYGNAFARAALDRVRQATTRLDPPTITNVIAIAAPTGGFGPYSARDVEFVLETAYAGFRAAALESERIRGGAGPVVVHTGFWGCGAFGANRVLMPALQLVAAELAGVTRLVFHAVDTAGLEAFDKARAYVRDNLAGQGSSAVADLVTRVVAHGFEWGVSDGN